MADPPEVTILLLGDSEVGKSTFLSYVFILAPLYPSSKTYNSHTLLGE